MPFPLLPFALALLTPTAPSGGGSVLVVDDDPTPGALYADIGDALAVAQDGDLILVRSGDYGGVHVDGVSVTICAEAGATVRVLTTTQIRNLPPGGVVALQGLDLRGKGQALYAKDNAGEVLVDECDLTGMNVFNGSTTHGAFVRNSASVTFAGCTLRVPQYGIDCHGLRAEGSNVQVYASHLQGADGGIQSSGANSPGGAGCALSGGRLVAVDSVFVGGDGQKGSLFNQASCPGGPGGPGLRAEAHASGDPEVVIVDSQLIGGAGGQPGSAGCNPGPAGAPIESLAGTVTTLAGDAPTFTVDSPVRSGGAATFAFEGLPGELASTLTNASLTPTLRASLEGVLFPARQGLARKKAGTLPGSGRLSVQRKPALAGGVAFEARFVQSFHAFGPSGLILGTPRLQVVLDPAY